MVKEIYCSGEGSVVCQLPSNRFKSESGGDLRPSTNFGSLDYQKLKQEELSLSENLDQVLAIASWLGEKTFWMVQTADFRGRLYPIGPYINHLAHDETRAMFKFKNGSKLGTGIFWMICSPSGPLRLESLFVDPL